MKNSKSLKNKLQNLFEKSDGENSRGGLRSSLEKSKFNLKQKCTLPLILSKDAVFVIGSNSTKD